MTITLFTAQHSYDPGFTIVATITPEGGETYLREKDGRITQAVSIPEHRWPEIKSMLYMAEYGAKALQSYMDNIAQSEQIRRGWREAA